MRLTMSSSRCLKIDSVYVFKWFQLASSCMRKCVAIPSMMTSRS